MFHVIYTYQTRILALRPSCRRVCITITAILFAAILSPPVQAESPAANSAAVGNGPFSASQRENVVSALSTYVKRSRFGPDRSTRYSAVGVPNTELVVAYLQGSTWCGSGGCTLLILRPSGSLYEVISKVLAVHTPILELRKTTNGLPEFGVWAQGGGIEVGYEAILSANRNGKYPLSATMSRKRTSTGSGKVLIGAADEGAMLLQ